MYKYVVDVDVVSMLAADCCCCCLCSARFRWNNKWHFFRNKKEMNSHRYLDVWFVFSHCIICVCACKKFKFLSLLFCIFFMFFFCLFDSPIYFVFMFFLLHFLYHQIWICLGRSCYLLLVVEDSVIKTIKMFNVQSKIFIFLCFNLMILQIAFLMNSIIKNHAKKPMQNLHLKNMYIQNHKEYNQITNRKRQTMCHWSYIFVWQCLALFYVAQT